MGNSNKLNQVKMFLWAVVLFVIMNTISAAVFAIQAGVVEANWWTQKIFTSIYQFNNAKLSFVELFSTLIVYVVLPFCLLLVVSYIFFRLFLKLKTKYPTPFKKTFKFLVSLKLAVIVIIVIGIISAIGTFVEAKYDAKMAQRLVFHSWYMYVTLFVLCVQLIAVMIDRWPWKVKHAAFVLAHIGIVVTLYGSLLTRYFGVDGSIIFDIGQKLQHITLNDEELIVYSSFADGSYALMSKQRVDFFKNTPTSDVPHKVNLGSQALKVTDYYHYAMRNSKLSESQDNRDNPALRFQLEGKMANTTKWLWAPRGRTRDVANMGPLEVVLTKEPIEWGKKKNAIHLWPSSKDSDVIEFQIFSATKQKLTKSGKLTVGDLVDTGFMDFKLRVINFFKHASEMVTYEKKQFPSNFTQPAIQVEFDGKTHWLGLNNLLRLYTSEYSFVVSYSNTRINMGFPMTLNKFNVGRYQGVMKAMTYESEVSIPGLPNTVISMNEPLKHNSYTFYQSSFQEDETGKPIASVLSVNKDPGRFLKYVGSLLIVLGSILLFYFKKVMAKSGRKSS